MIVLEITIDSTHSIRSSGFTMLTTALVRQNANLQLVDLRESGSERVYSVEVAPFLRLTAI